MRVALLKADYVNADLIGAHGDLPDMFRRFLGGDVAIDVYEVRFGALPDPRRYDACLITGSRHSVDDDCDWIRALLAFLRKAADSGARLIGFCFGHQALAKALGGRVGKGPSGWNVGLWPVAIQEHPAWMREAAGAGAGEAAGDRPGSVRPEIFSLFNHREQVLALPSEARIIASTERCPVQAFVLDDQTRQVLGIQFHPEYTLSYQEAIMAVPKTMPRTVFDDAIQRNRTLTRTDGIVREWVLRFAGAPRVREIPSAVPMRGSR
ncbi:type 1 glutamine amidotransferase [Pendulispora albinea]|uniref:Type 1 glutamine amidotransferase n=1 Tax=Pendulispora albinea TaxID=2741071 RepID=A0ABZ2M981_9BACT